MTDEQRAKLTERWVYDQRVGEAGVYADTPPDCLMDECPRRIAHVKGMLVPGVGWTLSREACDDLQLIVRMQNAFEVMIRRGWWVEPVSDGWRVPGWKSWPDPVTALIEADEWYKANVDTKEKS